MFASSRTSSAGRLQRFERPSRRNVSEHPSKTAHLLERERQYLSPATRLPFVSMVVERGRGASFWDVEGREYLDFHAMACITNTGHNHPDIVRAIQTQSETLIH